MQSRNFFLIVSFLTIIMFSSCVTKRKLTYLQYTDLPQRALSEDSKPSVTPSVYKIMPFDNLWIRVITPDPRWSEIFNPSMGGSGGSLTQESASLVGYPVDEQGYIEIPFVGKLSVGGKTLPEVKTELDVVFKNYLNDASITVRLVNNYVSIIGEVRSPGRYPLTKDRINVFEALSMAGDLGDYSDRQRVQLIRPSAYGPIVKEFSLTDRSILNSEFYYIMPNDIIYAQPLRGRTFLINSSLSSVLLGTITTVLTIIVFFRSTPAN